MLWAVSTVWAGGATAAIEQPVAVPSRQAVVLADVITDVPGNGLTYRFRFIAPHISTPGSFDASAADMQHLCNTYALTRISTVGPAPAQIVISLSDRTVPFGEASPNVTQFFEAYSPGETACVWESF